MTAFQRIQNVLGQVLNANTYKYCNNNLCLGWEKRDCPSLLRQYLCHSSKIHKLLLNFFTYSLSLKIQETSTKACRDRTRGNGFKQKEGWFRLVIRKKFFFVRMVRLWIRLPRELVDATSLEVFQPRLDGLLSNLVSESVPAHGRGGGTRW